MLRNIQHATFSLCKKIEEAFANERVSQNASTYYFKELLHTSFKAVLEKIIFEIS